MNFGGLFCGERFVLVLFVVVRKVKGVVLRSV